MLKFGKIQELLWHIFVACKWPNTEQQILPSAHADPKRQK